jgi:hypothetical protein
VSIRGKISTSSHIEANIGDQNQVTLDHETFSIPFLAVGDDLERPNDGASSSPK